MSKSTGPKSVVEEIDDVIPYPTPVDEAKAACPKLLPVKALDPQLRLEATAELSAALNTLADLDLEDGTEIDEEDTASTAALAMAMAEATRHARAFLRTIARKPEKFEKWASGLDDEVYVNAILDLFTEQVQLVGKSSSSDES